MKYKLTVLAVCLLATVLLAGCKGGGSGSAGFFGIGGSSGSSSGGGSIVASLPSGGGSTGSGAIGSDPVSATHNPEPATLGLLGSGLFAYAILKRKKRK